MIAAARSGDNDDGNPDTDLVVRCSNVQRNVFNEATCRISYHEDACTSVPLPDPDDFFRSNMHNPGDRVDELWKYLPTYSGPDSGGVIGECQFKEIYEIKACWSHSHCSDYMNISTPSLRVR